jgi:hypothetical protein
MKRLWLILLSLGLIIAFSTSVFASDVKFSGSYYAAGIYLDKTSLRKANTYYPIAAGPSTAFYFQRLRVQTDFIVTPALKLVTRFDAMERAWGAPRYSAGSNQGDYIAGNYSATSAGTTAENENIAFDLAYIYYASPIGVFTVGYQNDGTWGTVFGDSSVPRGKIGWSLQRGGWTLLAQIVKFDEDSHTAQYASTTTDRDEDMYIAGFIYNWKGGEAGMRYTFFRNASFRADSYPDGSLIRMHSLQPYAKAQIGPVTVQAELDYYWGKEKGEDGGTYYEGKRQAINFFLDAVADFNKFYLGSTFAYLSGNHYSSNYYEEIEGGYYNIEYGGDTGGGIDWSPCLIMWNFDRTYWAGGLYGWWDPDEGGIDSPMSNAWFGQLRGGVRPLAALDIMASVSYAVADEKPAYFLDDEYGWEIDLIATYKITSNLSYMLGVGYLFTGDFFKGPTTYDVKDDFLVINKLTFTF